MIARSCRAASRLLLLVALAATGLMPGPAAAESAPAPAVAPQAPAAAGDDGQPASGASLLLSASKATTYKIGTALTNMLVFSAGTGLVGGTVLTAFTTAQTWLIYTANDYFWDSYSPREARNGESFDVKESAWRSTEKFLTAKPLIVAIKLASIYAWTGSAAIMLIAGTISTVATTGVFYANNLGWDFYEWSKRPAAPAPVAPAPPAPPDAVAREPGT
jgi:hypothetical protein